MGSTKRSKNKHLTHQSLGDVVQHEGAQFDFHALVRLLESFCEDSTGVGEAVNPCDEPARFRALVTMEFPRSDVHRVVMDHVETAKGVVPLVETHFFGLAGVQGPLPAPYAQRILREMQNHSYAMRDFLDIFNHRLLALLHRIRKTYWVGVASQCPEETPVGQVLRAFIGENSWVTDHLVPIRCLLAMAMCFWQRPRSADLLRVMLSVFLREQVVLKLWQPGWRSVADSQQTAIGRWGRYQVLGQSVVLGQRFWDVTRSFTIQVGPVSLEQYYNLLRNGKLFGAIQNICHAYTGQQQMYRLNIIWSAPERPESRLGKARLGSTAWLRQDGPVHADQQTIMTYVVQEVR